MSRFDQRSTQKELMDDLDCSGEELAQTLSELKTINRWLGGNHVTLHGLGDLVAHFPQQSYTVADIGCGGGDMVKIMSAWAEKQQLQVSFIGIDANPNIIELAKVRQGGLKSVRWSVQNVFDSDFEQEQVDIVTCTLFTHHFTDSELVELFCRLQRKARLGIVINDLHRHPFAFFSIRLLTSLFSRSPMVKNDASLSVLRSFSKKDWKNILLQAGITHSHIRWFWAFRWLVLIRF